MCDASVCCDASSCLRSIITALDARLRAIGALLGRLLAFQTDTAALVRTTAAMTVLSAGTAHNVLPQTGNLTINFRHLPGQRMDENQCPPSVPLWSVSPSMAGARDAGHMCCAIGFSADPSSV